MVCSASSSSSPVLTPGLTCAVTAARARATTSPAARIAWSWPGVLISIPRPLFSTESLDSAQRRQRPLADFLDRTDRRHPHQDVPVVVQQRGGLRPVDPLPPTDDFLGVVAATPRQQPLDQLVVGHL